MEWLPQYTAVVRDGQPYRQELGRRSFFSDEHINYDWGIGRFVLAMEGGLSYLNRRMQEYHTRRYQTYLTPTLKYPHRDFNFTLRLPVSYFHYDFGDSSKDDVSYGTSLGISYRGIPHLTASLSGTISENPYQIANRYDGLLMTNYRTVTQGTTEYGTTTGKSLTLTAMYQNSSLGQFGFLTIILRRCELDNPYNLLWLKMRPDTPQHYEYILIEHITGKCRNGISVHPWTQFYQLDDRPDMPLSQCNNIVLRNINLQCRNFFNVRLSDKYVLRDFTFEDVTVADEAKEIAFDKSVIQGTTIQRVTINGKTIK